MLALGTRETKGTYRELWLTEQRLQSGNQHKNRGWGGTGSMIGPERNPEAKLLEAQGVKSES